MWGAYEEDETATTTRKSNRPIGVPRRSSIKMLARRSGFDPTIPWFEPVLYPFQESLSRTAARYRREGFGGSTTSANPPPIVAFPVITPESAN